MCGESPSQWCSHSPLSEVFFSLYNTAVVLIRTIARTHGCFWFCLFFLFGEQATCQECSSSIDNWDLFLQPKTLKSVMGSIKTWLELWECFIKSNIASFIMNDSKHKCHHKYKYKGFCCTTQQGVKTVSATWLE